jgi:hypothetical protein
MAAGAEKAQSRVVSDGRRDGRNGSQKNQVRVKSCRDFVRFKSPTATFIGGENIMKKLLTSTLLTVVAVPFLSAAPHAAKKAQNTTTSSTMQSTESTAKKGKKHVKKAKKTVKSETSTAAPAEAPKQ